MTTPTGLPTRVIKLGGSLLTLAALERRFFAWIAAQSTARSIVVAGGGELVDAIRRIDRVHGLEPQAAHWLAIRAMSVTSRIAAQLLNCRLVANFADIDAEATADRPVVLDVRSFLETEEPRLEGARLPSNWDATSDSIAARLAQALRAQELVLLKSTLPAEDATLESAARSAYVDAFFPRAAAEIAHVSCVDLSRGDTVTLSRLPVAG